MNGKEIRWQKGQKVEAYDEDAEPPGWFLATVRTVHRDGRYSVNWQGKWRDTFSKLEEKSVRPRRSGRDIGLNQLKGKDVGGIYVLNVPLCNKSYYKVGIAKNDIERRVRDYTTAYPWDYHIVAIMVYDYRGGDTWKRYFNIPKAEKMILGSFPAKNMVSGGPNKMDRGSEWLDLPKKEDVHKLRDVMEKVAAQMNVQ
eukprot:gene1553-46_t